MKERFCSTDWQLATEYTRIVLGMDQLYRSGSESGEAAFDREGLVPVNLTQEQPYVFSDWEQVKDSLRQLAERYMKINHEIRRNYMQQQISSLYWLATWCGGEKIPFRNKVREFLFVNENPLTQAECDQLHHQLDEALTARGYSGNLAEKVRAWEEDRRVPPNEVAGVLRELLDEAKERVVRMMFPQLDEVTVTPELVFGVPYNAYCDYVNGKMYLNGDLAYTYEALKHLVTHESFPGHTTHLWLREQGVQEGVLPPDAGLVITNTASSAIFEGIGDNAIFFIDWLTSEDDRIYQLYQKIRSISGLNAAHMLHAEERPVEEVADFLARFAFGQPAWIESRLRFVSHTLRSPFIYSYWRGNEAVRDVYRRVPSADRNRFYHFLYTNMLSVDTVKQFV